MLSGIIGVKGSGSLILLALGLASFGRRLLIRLGPFLSILLGIVPRLVTFAMIATWFGSEGTDGPTTTAVSSSEEGLLGPQLITKILHHLFKVLTQFRILVDNRPSMFQSRHLKSAEILLHFGPLRDGV